MNTVEELNKIAAQTNVDFERFRPRCWDDITGNEEIVEHLKSMLLGIRVRRDFTGWNTLITGPSRSGKTSLIKWFIRCVLCLNLADLENICPCYKCLNCENDWDTFGSQEWENIIDFISDTVKTPIRCSIYVVNCATTTERELDDIVGKVRVDDGMVKIVYLDEVHRLSRRNLDERLLKPLEDTKAIWLATSAYVKKDKIDDSSKLDPMFQNRFSFRLTTSPPSVKKLAQWLAQRCIEANLKVDEPTKDILTIVAERSKCIPGLALQVLNRAVKSRDRMLTKKLAEEFCFSLDG